MITFINTIEPWKHFYELKVEKNEPCTFLKKTTNFDCPMTPMIKLPIQTWDNDHYANFNCVNLMTGDLDFCNSGDLVLPVDIKMQLNTLTKANGFREEVK